MTKKPKKASKRKKLKVKELPMFERILDALRVCHQHIIKAPLTKDQIEDMENLMYRSSEAYMDDTVSEVWLLFGKEMKQMLIKDALISLHSD